LIANDGFASDEYRVHHADFPTNGRRELKASVPVQRAGVRGCDACMFFTTLNYATYQKQPEPKYLRRKQ
jgi:hypothetical protein